MFGENFPYTNFHDLNLDWIIKIAKDFLDQYTSIQDTITAGKTELQQTADQLSGALALTFERYQTDMAQQVLIALQNFRSNAQAIALEVIDTIPEDYTTLSNFVNQIDNGLAIYQDDNKLLLSRGNFDRNVFVPTDSGGYVNEYPYRISSRNAIKFGFDAVLEIATGFRINISLFSGGDWVAQGWSTGTLTIPRNTSFYAQIARVTEDTTETANVYAFLNTVTVKGAFVDLLSDEFDSVKTSVSFKYNVWENGGWDSAVGGQPEKADLSGIRIRNRNLTAKPNKIKVNIKQANVRVVVFIADADEDYTGTNHDLRNPGYYTINTASDTGAYVFMSVIFGTAAAVPDDLDEYFTVEFINEPSGISGKQVLVYQFGGAGNDWCFVRTPAGYDPLRAKPYPFVICNHGNGWVMDGTAAKANYTKRTMYVPLDDPDYVENPTQYNGTADSSLWYSNPTIEALLAAGYIVCGCENYGDLLYGNNNCRNACVDFYYHMIRNYNVSMQCCMIGVSNGALTALNAAYILGGAVKALYLQYPITCLVNQYDANSDQRAGIRAAYGISNSSISLADLADAVRTHDPLTSCVIEGEKAGYYPAVKLVYSASDTIVPASVNSVVFADLLDDSGLVVDTDAVTGGHGDAAHFDPSDTVAWFNNN